MMLFIVYKNSDGSVLRYGACDEKSLQGQAVYDGEAVIAVSAIPKNVMECRVINGEIVEL